MADRAELLPFEAFPAQAVQTLRYADHDQAGHVNNAVYSTMFEAGRVPILYDTALNMPPEGCHFSLVRITIDYLTEMTWPGDVVIGTGAARIGTSSVAFRQAIFKDGICCSTADSTVVLTNSTTRKSQPLPDQARAMFAELLLVTET
ncbi:thioesterase family protein [uncultured Roseibium sp.]|uniref:acyl-CoA thioesterase n=1 Tax=uncultured Roseibium sp. TaxID=1936171 RepID=UPI0032165FF0